MVGNMGRWKNITTTMAIDERQVWVGALPRMQVTKKRMPAPEHIDVHMTVGEKKMTIRRAIWKDKLQVKADIRREQKKDLKRKNGNIPGS